MQKRIFTNKFIVYALLPAALALGAPLLQGAADTKPQFTTKEVMKALHKGKENVGKKVITGQGTKEDFAKLAAYYKSLPLNTPPKGDKTSWNTKTTALLTSAKALEAGSPGALESYKKAVNCKACHSEHREDNH
jgi:hypothetical protein